MLSIEYTNATDKTIAQMILGFKVIGKPPNCLEYDDKILDGSITGLKLRATWMVLGMNQTSIATNAKNPICSNAAKVLTLRGMSSVNILSKPVYSVLVKK